MNSSHAWPLVGRTEELAHLISALTDPHGYAGVVVVGEAGVGKSRLVREALSKVAEHANVRWIVASGSARMVPLGAFAEWVREVGSDSTLLVQSVIESLIAGPRGRRVVVGIDDAHLLDDLSAFVVHQLVHRNMAKVVITLRKREAPPDAIDSLLCDAHFDRLDLHALSRTAAERLLGCVLDGGIDPQTAQRFWDLTRGNVLFLRHLLEQELAAHSLHKDTGIWVWSGRPQPFSTVGQLIDAQMGELSQALGELVDVLAVGEPLDSDVLADMVGWTAIEEAHAQGLIGIRESAVRLAHPLYGEVRRVRAGDTRMRRVRGRVYQTLAARAVVDSQDLIQRALLLLDSDLPPDGKLFTQAAGAAMQLLDPALTERLAGAARQVTANYEATALHTFAIHLVGKVTESERIIAEAADAQLTPNEQSNLAMFRAGNLFFGLGLVDRATRVLDEAQARIPADAHGAILAFRAAIEAANGSVVKAINCAQEVLASCPSDAAAMCAYFALVLAHGHAGRSDLAADLAKHAYLLAERAPDVAPIVFALADKHMKALIFAGYQSEAEAVATRLVSQTADIPVVSGAYVAQYMGQAHLGAGRVRDARRWLKRAMDGYTRFEGLRHGRIAAECDFVVALAACGDFDAAAKALSSLEANINPYGFLVSRCVMAAAWVLAAEGAMTEAAEQCRRAADSARRRGHFGQEVICLQTAARFGDSTTAVRLGELTAVVDGPRVGAASAHATALANGDPDGLACASQQFEEMGDGLAALDAAAQAVSLYRRSGERGKMLSAKHRVQRLVEGCQGADTPALREAMEVAPLTARQREILSLASKGLSNRQIADRLGVSVRTIEGHRYRARSRL